MATIKKGIINRQLPNRDKALQEVFNNTPEQQPQPAPPKKQSMAEKAWDILANMPDDPPGKKIGTTTEQEIDNAPGNQSPTWDAENANYKDPDEDWANEEENAFVNDKGNDL